MVSIVFESHATTTDNENRICSGHFDAKLSEFGKKQAEELGARHVAGPFAAIFCSDLSRSVETARLAFHDRYPVVQDARLRECDYGQFTHCTRAVMDEEQFKRISVPFPEGESYEQAFQRMKDFLTDLYRDYNSQRVMIIGHGATCAALEHYLNGLTVKDALIEARKWKPGREYELHGK